MLLATHLLKEACMISLSAAAGIAIIELGLALTPGPNMMYLVSRSISRGGVLG